MAHARETSRVGSGLDAAVKAAGSGAALARIVKRTRGVIPKWRRFGIPADLVPTIARETGVPKHELRPDLFDAPVRECA